MAKTSVLLAQKQVTYLYQSMTLSVTNIFLAISLVLYLLWDLQSIRELLIYWYVAGLFILSLRVILYVLYKHSLITQPGQWISLFITGSCLSGAASALIIFIIPEHLEYYYSYVLLFLGTMLIASVASLGVSKQAFLAYLLTLSTILGIFFLRHNYDFLSFHFYAYVIIFLFAASAALHINKSLLSAFTREIENSLLRKNLTKETSERIHAENELREKAQELQTLNESLEYKVREKTTELKNLAFYDTLTQLPNRHYFYDYLKRTLARNKSTKEPFALFFIDLDEFKTINDTLGHDFGDELLVKVGSRLRSCTRVDDFIARISGDEFVVILKGELDEHKIAEIANNIIHSVSLPYTFSDSQTFISCSLGIALYPQDGETANTLIKYSDLAMYYAKEHGKNSFYFYNNELYKEKAKKFILATALKMAVKKHELYLVYQPQVVCHNEQVSSMEVLLRWHSAQFGLVPVNKFISLAEESRQILELEDFVLHSALQQVQIWNNQSQKNFRVAVNISAVHFQQKSFVQEIEGLLAQLNYQPQLLELELTESALMNNTQEAIDKLVHLKSLGIRISIDDFGTGYSSLSYLKQLPIDVLKIDKSFIDGIPVDQDNNAITKAIIELAHQFNLETIAEGVEYRHQLDFLKTIGCHLIQGYYFYKPMKADEFERKFIFDRSDSTNA